MFSKVSLDQFAPLLLPLVFALILNQCTVAHLISNPICRRIPNLNPQQVKLCQRSPDIVPVIRSGIQLALRECERLFHSRAQVHPSAWNCSSWIANSTNGLFLNITDQDVIGTKEAAFGHALFSAGVTYALAEACTRTNFSYCSCGATPPVENDLDDSEDGALTKREARSEWKWQGCPQNAEYGVETARQFLDSIEQRKVSPYGLINLYNNLVGRRTVKSEFQTRCQCHGYSGACTTRTCWRTLNVFPQTVHTLYGKYERAKEVSYGWLFKWFRARIESNLNHKTSKGKHSRGSQNNSKLKWLKQLQTNMTSSVQLELNQPSLKRILIKDTNVGKRDLIFLEQSANFCTHSTHRHLTCRVNSTISNLVVVESGHLNVDTCDTLCCGRGYRPKARLKVEKCECEFKFCCSLECRSECTRNTTEYECL